MSKPIVIVTGAKGQLGVDMVNLLSLNGYEVYGFGRDELNITDPEKINQIFNRIHPDIVIHTAAYTKVDAAETDKDQVFLVNAYGTRNIAVASENCGAKLVYVSTDYVFDGNMSEPINEFVPPSPINIYGKSKLAGEQMVRDLHSRFFIVRTSWVFGKNGNNFVKTMVMLAQEGKNLRVVNDQVGSPTYTNDLSQAIINLIGTEKYGIYHITNSGSCSWFEFACTIFEEAKLDVEVVPVSSNEFIRPAARPSYSVLDPMALRLNGCPEIRHWREALCDYLK